jgi:signal recognition particle subunit SRP54
VAIARKGVGKFRNEKYDLVVVDTAGRHKNEIELINEMKELASALTPDEIVLAVDGSIGQAAMNQAKAFNEATRIGSILVTKLDGTAKGGGALSAVAATGAKIKFVSAGEKIEDLEQFIPANFVGRMLGMGDIEALVQKVRDAEIKIPAKKARALMEGRFTLQDMYDQMEQVRKLGPLKKIMGLIPGAANLPEEATEVAEKKLDSWRVIIQSMTQDEIDDPKLIESSRARRIARGSGTSEREVKELLTQYSTMRKMMKSLKVGRGQSRLMKQLQMRG